MYRGTTGSENNSGPLFMTDNPEYAASYIKNGGEVIKVTIPRSTLYQMEFNGHIQKYNGLNTSGFSGVEYRINSNYKSDILNLSTKK